MPLLPPGPLAVKPRGIFGVHTFELVHLIVNRLNNQDFRDSTEEQTQFPRGVSMDWWPGL
jgi:hypothetical protein